MKKILFSILILMLLVNCAEKEIAKPVQEVVPEEATEMPTEEVQVTEAPPEPTKEIVKPAVQKTEAPKKITEEEVRAIALKRVPGRITDFDVEVKFGKQTYVVEIRPTSGPETDVIIDMQTGEVLGIET